MDADRYIELIKEEMDYLGWEERKSQIRCIFTTMALYFHLEADTYVTDNILYMIYEYGKLESIGILYEKFENFMIEYIV